MLELIALIRSETDTRRFQKTREDSTPRQSPRGYQVGLAARPPMAHMSSSVVMSVLHRLLGCIYAVLLVGLIQGITMDALAYIYTSPSHPLRHQVI